MKISSTNTATSASFVSESGNSGKKKRSAFIKMQKENEIASALLKIGNERNKILKDRSKMESERYSIHHEYTLTERVKGNHENLKNARRTLLEMRQVPWYDSDASQSQEAKKHIDLFKKMYTESFDDLNHLNIN